MEKRRLLSLLCAIAAAMLVIMVGKSCMDKEIKGGKKDKSPTNPTGGVHIIYPTLDPNSTAPSATAGTPATGFAGETTSSPTDPGYLTIVDADGNVIGTIPNDPEYVGGLTGESDAAETTTDPFAPYVPEVDPNKYSGFYHGEPDPASTTSAAVNDSGYVFDPNDLSIVLD